jgi:hypothetical protein
MTASVQNPADLANIALVRLGFRGRVGNLYDGSAQSKRILDVYAHTRDELLRSYDWGFAERNVPMTLLKTAPPDGYVPPLTWTSAYPPLPWLFEYIYPSDCLKVRAVKPTPISIPNFDPQPYVWSVDNDNSLAPPARVILCNAPLAILVYTGQITDPTTWDEGFSEAFAASLARRIAPALASMDAAKFEAQDEAAADAMGEKEQG